jgi:hypothetical protein
VPPKERRCVGAKGILAVVPADDPSATQHDRDRQWAAWPIRCWSTFPVDAVPRPLILQSTVRMEGTFASREAKIAFRRGDVISSGAVPETVLDVVRQWGIVNAVGIEAGPLEITNARRAQAEFKTDRGVSWAPGCSVSSSCSAPRSRRRGGLIVAT